MIPISVILDPTLTIATPTWLWLSTGRSIMRSRPVFVEQPADGDGASLHALRLLGQDCAQAMPIPRIWPPGSTASWVPGCRWSDPKPVSPKGLPAALGMCWAAPAVPHGYTSVMLPHVLRFNKPVNGTPGMGRASLGYAPRRSHRCGRRPDRRARPAGHAAGGGCARRSSWTSSPRARCTIRMVRTNPRTIEGPAVVRQLLDAAW